MKTQPLILFFLLEVIFAYGQIDTAQIFTVRRPTPAAVATFTYNGKPISPEALYPFLPLDFERGDTLPVVWVNLKDSVYKWPVETSRGNIFRVYMKTREVMEGTAYEVQDIVTYTIVGKTSDNKFVLDVSHNTGGSFTMPYIFVFKVVGNKLLKVAMFDAEPQYLNPTIILKDDVIYTGDKVYPIPK